MLTAINNSLIADPSPQAKRKRQNVRFVVESGNNHFNVHSCVLSAQSLYFEKACDSNFSVFSMGDIFYFY